MFNKKAEAEPSNQTGLDCLLSDKSLLNELKIKKDKAILRRANQISVDSMTSDDSGYLSNILVPLDNVAICNEAEGERIVAEFLNMQFRTSPKYGSVSHPLLSGVQNMFADMKHYLSNVRDYFRNK